MSEFMNLEDLAAHTIIPANPCSPLSSVIQQLADLTDRLEDPQSGMVMEIEQVTVNLPIELNVASEEDRISLYSSAPTQTVETSIFPVLHRMKLTIVAADGQ